MTWSDDDNQYAMYGDGGGFDGNNIYTDPNRASFGVARVEGDYDNYAAINRYGGVNRECASTIIGKSHGAPISIGGVLYAWVTTAADSYGFGSFVLYRSIDKACTWDKLDVVFTMDTRNPASNSDDEVAYGGFVQFGKDNRSAIDGYVYTVATKPTTYNDVLVLHKPGEIMLLRVPAAAIDSRAAYEFFAGTDSKGQALWSKDANDKQPIYTDATGVGTFPQVIYVPDIKRFVYTNQYGDGTLDANGKPAGDKALLTMAQAKNVWGPYTVFYRDKFTSAVPAGHTPAVDDTIFQWNFSPKWFRNKRDDGIDFTMTFSGTGQVDSWNTIDGSFELSVPE
jgi:hypothetical protein